jgi:uncharacterized protein (DUF305 family)
MNLLSRLDPHGSWRAAFATGLVSGTFSTLLVTLGAARIGRDAPVDWMQISTAYFGADRITLEPTWLAILGGLFVHQTADLGWAVGFFGVGGRLTRRLSPAALLLFGLPWAIVTAAIEYWVILPWLQPIVPMQVPYWTALMVHVTSAAAYPVFYPLRAWISGEALPHARFGRRWALALIAPLAFLGLLAWLGNHDREVPLPIVREDGQQSDRQFLRMMTAHHEVGVWMSKLVADRAVEPELRMLGRLMVAGQQAEINVMQAWWRSWYDDPMPEATPEERIKMPGMPTPGQLAELGSLYGKELEQPFIRLMVQHHKGAVMMSRETWGARGDPRIFPLAASIIHAQVRQMDALERHCTCRQTNPALDTAE